MPTYGYECLSCDNQFEINQSIKADALTTCDECGGTLRKRIYPVGIAFKGSGFYVNDYAPKSGGPSKTDAPKTETPKADASTTEAKSDAAKPETPAPKAESAPAPKADPKPAAPAAS
ncbi:MAG: FmdB family transcriptional regulator [Armatimonadota bacterium]|nr:FmdB family transcriptional regulator [Armatimonadota bacterium]